MKNNPDSFRIKDKKLIFHKHGGETWVAKTTVKAIQCKCRGRVETIAAVADALPYPDCHIQQLPCMYKGVFYTERLPGFNTSNAMRLQKGLLLTSVQSFWEVLPADHEASGGTNLGVI